MNSNYQSENPLKTFIQSLVIVLVIFILSLFLKSCASKPIEKIHTVDHIVEYKTDSVQVTAINNAILDSIIIQVSKVKTTKPECDSITQVTLDQLLSQLNSRKKSGDNEVGIYYDDIKKMIVAWQKVAQTQNEKLVINKTAKETSVEKQIVEVPIKYIPLWIKCFAFLGFASIAFFVWRIAKIWV